MLVTEQRLRAIYTLLVQCPPFHRWGLPSPLEVKFELLANADHAEYSTDHKDRMTIAVNPDTHTALAEVIESVAHEMVHLRQDLKGRLPCKEPHNAEFRRWARVVCVALGFDRQRF